MTLSETHPGEMLPVKVIRLTRGQFAIIDPEDFDAVSQFSWHAMHRGHSWYACRTFARDGRRTTQYLHTFLTGSSYCDHKNRHGLDNRHANLRDATHAQNMANIRRQSNNTSGHAGVRLEKGKWVVTAGSGKRYIGRFPDFLEAVQARHAVMAERYGEYAPRCCD